MANAIPSYGVGSASDADLVATNAGSQQAQALASATPSLEATTFTPSPVTQTQSVQAQALTSAMPKDPYGNTWTGTAWVSPEGNVFAEGEWWDTKQGLVYRNGAWVSPQAQTSAARAFNGDNPPPALNASYQANYLLRNGPNSLNRVPDFSGNGETGTPLSDTAFIGPTRQGQQAFIREYQVNSPQVSTDQQFAIEREKLQNTGIDPTLLNLAKTVNFGADFKVSGAYYTPEQQGQRGTITQTPSDYYQGALIHESLHALESLMTPAETQEMDQLRKAYPPPPGAASDWHVTGLAPYADTGIGSTLGETAFFNPSTLTPIPQPIIDFINRVIARIKSENPTLAQGVAGNAFATAPQATNQPQLANATAGAWQIPTQPANAGDQAASAQATALGSAQPTSTVQERQAAFNAAQDINAVQQPATGHVPTVADVGETDPARITAIDQAISQIANGDLNIIGNLVADYGRIASTQGPDAAIQDLLHTAQLTQEEPGHQAKYGLGPLTETLASLPGVGTAVKELAALAAAPTSNDITDLALAPFAPVNPGAGFQVGKDILSGKSGVLGELLSAPSILGPIAAKSVLGEATYNSLPDPIKKAFEVSGYFAGGEPGLPAALGITGAVAAPEAGKALGLNSPTEQTVLSILGGAAGAVAPAVVSRGVSALGESRISTARDALVSRVETNFGANAAEILDRTLRAADELAKAKNVSVAERMAGVQRVADQINTSIDQRMSDFEAKARVDNSVPPARPAESPADRMASQGITADDFGKSLARARASYDFQIPGDKIPNIIDGFQRAFAPKTGDLMVDTRGMTTPDQLVDAITDALLARKTVSGIPMFDPKIVDRQAVRDAVTVAITEGFIQPQALDPRKNGRRGFVRMVLNPEALNNLTNPSALPSQAAPNEGLSTFHTAQPIEGTPHFVVDTSGYLPPEIATDLASAPYTTPYVSAAGRAFDIINQAAQQIFNVSAGTFQGLGLGRSYRGINIDPTGTYPNEPHRILINLFENVRTTNTILREQNLPRSEFDRVLAEVTIEAVTHEIAHLMATGHKADFTAALTQLYRDAAPQINDATAILTQNYDRVAIQEGFNNYDQHASNVSSRGVNAVQRISDELAAESGRSKRRPNAGGNGLPVNGGELGAQPEGSAVTGPSNPSGVGQPTGAGGSITPAGPTEPRPSTEPSGTSVQAGQGSEQGTAEATNAGRAVNEGANSEAQPNTSGAGGAVGGSTAQEAVGPAATRSVPRQQKPLATETDVFNFYKKLDKGAGFTFLGKEVSTESVQRLQVRLGKIPDTDVETKYAMLRKWLGNNGYKTAVKGNAEPKLTGAQSAKLDFKDGQYIATWKNATGGVTSIKSPTAEGMAKALAKFGYVSSAESLPSSASAGKPPVSGSIKQKKASTAIEDKAKKAADSASTQSFADLSLAKRIKRGATTPEEHDQLINDYITEYFDKQEILGAAPGFGGRAKGPKVPTTLGEILATARAGTDIWRRLVEGALEDKARSGTLALHTRAFASGINGTIRDSSVSLLVYHLLDRVSELSRGDLPLDVASYIAEKIDTPYILSRTGRSIGKTGKQAVHDALHPMSAEERDSLLGVVDRLVQRAKVSAFGVGDVAVLGLNIPLHIWRGGVPTMIGMAGRALNVTNKIVDFAPINDVLSYLTSPLSQLDSADMPKEALYAALGLRLGVGPSGVESGLPGSGYGTGSMLQYVPHIGPWLDKKPIPGTARWSDMLQTLQYEGIMNKLAMLNLEGRMLLHAMIDPQTRRALKGLYTDSTSDLMTMNKMADAASNSVGHGHNAQTPNRNMFERLTTISQRYTRSMFENMNELLRIVNFKSSTYLTDILIAAMSILSASFAVLMIGKHLNDWFGQDKFVTDPSAPGFGYITVKDPTTGKNHSIGYIPQASIQKGILRSGRILTDFANVTHGGGTPQDLAELWTRTLAGRAGTPVSVTALAAANIGFDTQGRFQSGSLFGKRDVTLHDTFFNLLPLPPMLKDMLQNGPSPVGTTAETAGFSHFVESATITMGRTRDDTVDVLIKSGVLPFVPEGTKYFDLGPGEQKAVNDYIAANNPQLVQDYQNQRRQDQSVYQKTADAATKVFADAKPQLDAVMGEIINGKTNADVAAATARLKDIQKEIYGDNGALHVVYNDPAYKDAVSKLPASDIRSWVDLMRFGLIDSNKSGDGTINWDAVSADQSAAYDYMVQYMGQGFADRVVWNMANDTTQRHPVFDLLSQVSNDSQGYFNAPDRTAYLAANPQVDVERWFVQSSTPFNNTLHSPEAIDLALQVAPNREIGGIGLGTIQTQDWTQFRSQLVTLATMDVTAEKGEARTNLRKRDALSDYLYYKYIGNPTTSGTNKGKVNVYNLAAVQAYIRQYGARPDGAVPY